jgi:hypothetical protein
VKSIICEGAEFVWFLRLYRLNMHIPTPNNRALVHGSVLGVLRTTKDDDAKDADDNRQSSGGRGDCWDIDGGMCLLRPGIDDGAGVRLATLAHHAGRVVVHGGFGRSLTKKNERKKRERGTKKNEERKRN